MGIPQPVSIMTASLTPGDAIGNYVLTLKRLLEKSGVEVQLYADHIEPHFGTIARPATDYRPGPGTLWYHYSIYADSIAQIDKPAEAKIIDYHGVSPPRLFGDYDSRLSELCRRGEAELLHYSKAFNLSIVHSDYTRQELLRLGFDNVRRLPLVVDTSRFSGSEDVALSGWLSRLSYLLFVGRIVPQKDILSMLKVFRFFHQAQPEAVLVLAGGRHLAPRYQREIDREVRCHRLEDRVLFTGQINRPTMLTSLYRHAQFTLITSEWESFCVPIVESMAFGTPLVVHDIPPLPEVMGRAGIVIDKGRPAAAATAINELWHGQANYPDLVQSCIQRAGAFTEVALASQLQALLEDVFRDV